MEQLLSELLGLELHVRRGWILCAIAFFPACQKCDYPSPTADRQIYLVLGQSNATNRFNTPPLGPEETRITTWVNGAWVADSQAGMADAFAREMLRLNPSSPIGTVNCAARGTASGEWLPGTALLENCIVEARQAIASGGIYQGIIVMQGESDAGSWDFRWKDNFLTTISYTWRQLGTVPVVFGQLGNREGDQQQMANFREMQSGVHAKYIKMIGTNDLPIEERMHFTLEGSQVLGKRFADAISPWCPDNACHDQWYSRLIPH